MGNENEEDQKWHTLSILHISSIPEIYEQQLMHERLMCIQQMMTSGQNFASMFNDDPHFAQQIMSYIAAAQQQNEPEVIEIMDE